MMGSNVRMLIFGGWLTMMAAVLAITIAMGAGLATTSFLLALAAAPPVMMVLLKGGASSPSVSEMLHPVSARDSRS